MPTEGIFVAVGGSDLGERNQIGYSTDGQVWNLATETNGLFSGPIGYVLGYGGYGIAYDGKGLFVAVGKSELAGKTQIGYSTDGKVWNLATKTNDLFGGGGVYGFGKGIAYGNGRFVTVGTSNLGERNKFGYSTDGKVWNIATETNDLFGGGGSSYGAGITYGNGIFVAVGNSTLGERNKIGYSTDGKVWNLATETNGLFGKNREFYGGGDGITYGNGLFVAVGFSELGEKNKIGYSTDGKVWTLATNTNDLFMGGGGGSIAYDGNGLFVAVGGSETGGINKIGYSKDGKVWNLATETNGLFDGVFNYGLGITYGNGRFVAVGSSNSGDKKQIGYSTDGKVWNLTTETNGLFVGNPPNTFGGYGITYAPPAPIPLPISNICFPAGTPIQTDQGVVKIEKINTQTHTINEQPIRRVTQTTTLDKYLIRFDKHAVAYQRPSAPTLMTKDHLIEFDGQMVPAYRFLDCADGVKKVKYNGETLYNVLLSGHGKMTVNNLVCETLHPENIIAKLYNSNYSADEQFSLIKQLNKSLTERDLPTYKKIINTLHTTA